MQTTRRKLVYSLLRGTVALFATAATGLLGTSSVAAQVVFDDGETHVIDDATYEFERIEVRAGSDVIIEDGAVIAASIGPEFEVAIQVYDTSRLTVRGGAFGGDRLGEPGPNFEDNWFSGSVAAFDEAELIIEDGTFGACAFRSGAIFAFDNATLLVSGGTFASPGGMSSGGLSCQAGGGRIELWDDSEATVSGGFHASSIHPENSSTLHISGGVFGSDVGGGRGVVGLNEETPTDSATLTISGGHFGAAGPFSGVIGLNGRATAEISGGTYGGTGPQAGAVFVAESAFANITGGQFDGTVISVDPGRAKIEGCEFNLPFGPVAATSSVLLGVLASGDMIDVTITRSERSDAVIDLAENCAPPPVSFLRGDCNDDGTVNVADATCSLNYLFGEVAEPGCLAALNTNGDSDVNIADPVTLLNYLFGGGTTISAPFPECGPGMLPADEEVGCANPSDCQ